MGKKNRLQTIVGTLAFDNIISLYKEYLKHNMKDEFYLLRGLVCACIIANSKNEGTSWRKPNEFFSNERDITEFVGQMARDKRNNLPNYGTGWFGLDVKECLKQTI